MNGPSGKLSKEELQNFVDSHLGLRLKEEINGDITIYGNSWTFIIDIWKHIFKK